MRRFGLLLLLSCATSSEEKASQPTWQDEMNGAIDRSHEDERIASGYYNNVHCPAAQQPEWASASAVDKARMQKDCRLKAMYESDGGVSR